MFNSSRIYTVTEFSSRPEEHLKRLSSSKRPEILTVNGKAQVVIQDAQVYEALVSLLDSVLQISISVKKLEEGKSKPLDVTFSDIKQRFMAKYPNAKI